MESLSSVGTIVKIAQEVAGAVSTVSRNRCRCRKLAKRVQGVGDLLRELDQSTAGSDDEATRRLLVSLEDTLHRALELVRSCQDSGCPRSLIAGGRMADRFDEVDGEIDRCLLDLGVANRILIARLERLLHQNAFRYRDPAAEAAVRETVTLRIGMPCDDSVEHIKHRIHTVQGVTDVVAASASSKDQFSVTVRSGAVDVASLLQQVKEKLNRNVELVKPIATAKDAGGGVRRYDGKDSKELYSKANNKGGTVDTRYCSGDETRKEKAASMASAMANMVATNQAAPAPYAYLPFAVALVPIGDVAGTYHLPSPYSFLPYTQAPPGNAQSYRHHVPAPAKKYGGGGDTKVDTVKDSTGDKVKFTADSGGGDKKASIGDVAGMGMYNTPSPYSFGTYPQGPPDNAQPYRHRMPAPAKKYGGGGDTNTKVDAMKDAGDMEGKKVKFTVDCGGGDKKAPIGGGEWKNSDKTAAAGKVTAIGVPVNMVTAGVHELVPPPSYRYGYWPHAEGLSSGDGGYRHSADGGPSDAVAPYDPQFQHMFSDENPNACSIL